MALIENHIKVDEGAISKIFSYIKTFINQPRWLLVLLFLTLSGSATYFTYTGHKETVAVDNIQLQIDQINNQIDDHLNIDEYTLNLLTVIEALKIYKHDNDRWYDNDGALIDAFITYVQRNNPNDPLLIDLRAIKQREKFNQELLDKEYSFLLKRLDNFVKAHSDSLKYAR